MADGQFMQRLSQIIQRGECVLFLGAGVSLDSGAPRATVLADEIGSHFFNYDPGNFPLGEVCELVDANEGRPALNEWLIERFSSLSPQGALLSIPKFRWKSIYTMNFDTLLEGAYKVVPDRLQDLHPFYSDRDPLGHLKSNEVALYKLHGCLSRANSPEGKLVLTLEDYARVRDSRQRLFNRLLDDAADATILYVGFRRQDSDFAEVLIEVEKSFGDLVPPRRSYALQPGFNEQEERRWEQKRVTLINSPAATFFDELESQLPVSERYLVTRDKPPYELPPLAARKPSVSANIVANIEQNFELIDERITEAAPNTAEFFLGASPNWGVIAAQIDAARDVTDDIIESALKDNLLDRGGAQFILIHAEAGTGKTTLLRRIGVELALTWDKVVLSTKIYGSLDFLDLERLVDATGERVYVLVDDATGVARELSATLKSARQAHAKLTIIASARTNEWREIQEDFALFANNEFELGRLSTAEIDKVLDTLSQHNSLGLLTGTSRETQLAAFESRAGKQLLVALREATEGKAFDEIVVDEYDRIPTPDGQRAYLLVSALHRLGILTRAGLLHRALDIPLAELGDRVFAPTEKVIISQVIVGETEQYYSARHQLIADIVFDRRIGSDRRRLEYYANIITHLDIGYASDADAYRKLSRSKNQQLLRDFRDASSKRELMEELVKVDPTDAFTYQHAAMMEMDEGNLEAASRYLENAVKLRPGDPAIRDTDGLLALASADKEADPHLADVKYAQAESMFERNIQRRKDEPFGYRHLAQTYTGWSRIQNDKGRKLHYVGLAYHTLLDGIAKCSSASMLHQFMGKLDEYFDDPANARIAFQNALKEKPGDVVTRFMAARLEEKEGQRERALEILKEGLNASAQNPELHYRIALLMAVLDPEKDAEIRSHFQAALLGSVRNYMPRLAYAAYLFTRGDFAYSAEQFEQLEELVVSGRERFEPHKFQFRGLDARYEGRVKRVAYDYAFVEYGHGAVDLFAPLRGMGRDFARKLFSSTPVSYRVEFNLKGPVAVELKLIEP